MELTPEEQNLVEYAKATVVWYNRIRRGNGEGDTMYAFILSEGGKIHDGARYEASLSDASICAERIAIANMVMMESSRARIKSIVIADCVPEVQANGTPPCGTCRQLIWTHGTPRTSVILVQYIQKKRGWVFPVVEKYYAGDFYPHPYEPREGNCDDDKPED